MTNADVDRLGDRLRDRVTAEDLTALDTYRRRFRSAYDSVVDRLRTGSGVEASGRPAKSTAAIVDKLRRGSMRLTQMQDIAGCRTVVADITTQSRLVRSLEQMFDITVLDRRDRPSHGYRAVHAIARVNGLPVEVQVRTDLQHVWAELSEKLSDKFGTGLKYGGGPPAIRRTLDAYSSLIADFERELDADGLQDERVVTLKSAIRAATLDVSMAWRQQT